MAKEYIEREAFREYAMEMTESTEIQFDMCYPYWQFSKAIKEMPAADVAPVRRGQWGLYEDTHEHLVKYVCPFCYNYVGFRHDPGEDTVRGNYIYCHSCGAKLGDDEQ